MAGIGKHQKTIIANANAQCEQTLIDIKYKESDGQLVIINRRARSHLRQVPQYSDRKNMYRIASNWGPGGHDQFGGGSHN